MVALEIQQKLEVEPPVLYDEADFPVVPDEVPGWGGNSPPEVLAYDDKACSTMRRLAQPDFASPFGNRAAIARTGVRFKVLHRTPLKGIPHQLAYSDHRFSCWYGFTRPWNDPSTRPKDPIGPAHQSWHADFSSRQTRSPIRNPATRRHKHQ